MSKFNLFADEPTLARETLRSPVAETRPSGLRTATAGRTITPVFLLGVVLWFIALFAMGELILLR
jgi:hypothetical protein